MNNIWSNEQWLTDWHIAVFWWVQAFGNDYEKFLEAMFPWDEDKKAKFLQDSKEWKKYREQLDCKLREKWLDWGVISVSNFINLKVFDIMNWINIYVK